MSESELFYDWQFQSQSHVTTDGQLASLSWCQAPTWGPKPDFCRCQFWVCWCEVPSLMRERVCCLQLLLAHANAVILGSESESVTFKLGADRQSVRLGAKPLEAHNLRFFQLNPSSHSPYVTPSDERMNILGLLSSVCIVHISCYWKFRLLQCIQALCQSRLCKPDHAYLTYLVLQRQLSHLNGCKLDHRPLHQSLII
jgi:hypothetical protein